MTTDGDDRGGEGGDEVAGDLVRLMPRDVVFSIRFLGESQIRLQKHFQDFLIAELERAGITGETHPMIHAFAERHAIAMRDFVFTGVALSKQYRIAEFERLIGDETALIRVDIWDRLKTYIAVAEADFRAQLPEMRPELAVWEAPDRAPPGERD
ncbi:hypothetical protein [Oharaeibacter diazotrophicus]|uniref:Uncharacterized protein n=1 Tax=Oharaeibacter diazotrophicus TaxID=1920512 RepID=A0A4R6RFF8_9HYPH|nr:hypothetical protein [Oharaeibacter diazotrophicus]TDP84962.1 hypothetical protein EDD54_1806 [Oharaeibacter diazotrophicus]BBE73931.1 hypothetical protein OHA_1_03556 [Pleomorphomonas sp. SM30]